MGEGCLDGVKGLRRFAGRACGAWLELLWTARGVEDGDGSWQA